MLCFKQQDRPGGHRQTHHAGNQDIHLGIHRAGRGVRVLQYN